MKKNNTLFKTIVILFIVFSIMSWIIPAGKASGAEITSLGLSRISLYNLIEYPYLCLKFFIEPILYILVVGGFYGVLSKTGKYRNALEKIAKSLKGKETIFLVAVAFILAALNSVFGFNVILFAFIPALCGIILLMGYDKITAFLVTRPNGTYPLALDSSAVAIDPCVVYPPIPSIVCPAFRSILALVIHSDTRPSLATHVASPSITALATDRGVSRLQR